MQEARAANTRASTAARQKQTWWRRPGCTDRPRALLVLRRALKSGVVFWLFSAILFLTMVQFYLKIVGSSRNGKSTSALSTRSKEDQAKPKQKEGITPCGSRSLRSRAVRPFV
jgi:hypothetical protein